MQIVFMGTPDFAVGALEALIAQGHEITDVYKRQMVPSVTLLINALSLGSR